MPTPKRKLAPEKGTRALFRDEAGQIVTSIFVDREGSTILLQRDYPPGEFAPQVGWTVEGRGFKVRITAVARRRLTVANVPQGEE